MTQPAILKERPKSTAPGIPVLLLLIGLLLLSVFLFISGIIQIERTGTGGFRMMGAVLLFLATLISFGGLMSIQPNQAIALTLFGKYVGTARTEGLRWANPFLSKKKISLRVRNFDSDKLKVNELEGSPVEIGAIVVWRVVDSAQALFGVDDFEEFVEIQAESAIRAMATSYPYDGHDEPDVISLRSHPEEISNRLQEEIQGRLEEAGVDVIEARISHLAYAPEIASAMLQRQQAGAIVAARARIVAGAVGMVEQALAELGRLDGMELDPERRASMASNLLVVLCGDRNPQPVVNAGSLY